MIGYIYKITNTQNGKVYIGKTIRTVAIRWEQHIKRAKQRVNNYLYDAMNHYGYDNFSIETIDTCPKEDLNEREKYWINVYDTQENGYNRTCGGDGGNTWELNQNKEITSQRLSQSIRNSEAHKLAVNSPEYKEKISKINKGRKFSKEFRDKVSKAAKLRFQNPRKREAK
jgi:group I intron endonuclease